MNKKISERLVHRVWERLLTSLWLTHRGKKFESEFDHNTHLNRGIGAEVPIRTFEQDLLRRADFASRIADVLSEISLQEGRVFAIRGGWGFGKSSLKNLIAENLESKKHGASWLDFNPWQWGDTDSIARALFGQIADKLGGEYSTSASSRAAILRRYGYILTGAATPIKGTGGSTKILSAILTNASVIAIASAVGFELPTVAKLAAALAVLAVVITAIGKTLSYIGRDRTNDPLDKIRRTLEGSLRKLDRPLVVFVDDIDRLEPEQIRTLLRQVKVNANLPNIIFVLLFQPSIVESALDPIAGGRGRAFLEKVVQVNFDLPAVPAPVVHKIFGEELSALAGKYATEENGFDPTRWGNIFVGCIQPHLRNIRDARRLVSSIAVHLPLHANSDTFEVNIIDFFTLETVRVFEPDLYGALFQERDLLLQSDRYIGSNRRGADKTAIERLLSIIPEERRIIGEEILKQLFPQLEGVLGNANYGSAWQVKWIAAKRVCGARHFQRYFELQTADGELSESEFVSFLTATADATQLTALTEEIDASGLLPSLVSRLDESVDRLPIENASVLLPHMFRIGQKLAGATQGQPFNSPWVSAWRATSWFLRRIPQDVRGRMAIEALKESQALSVAAVLIHLNDPEDQKEEEKNNFDPELDAMTVAEMKAEWLRQVRGRLGEPDGLINEKDLLTLLYRWGKYAGSLEEPRAWVKYAINTDEGFVEIVSRMMSRGTRQTIGDHVSTPFYSFHQETIENFIGVAEAGSRIRKIDYNLFPDNRDALQTLKEHIEKWEKMV